MLKTNFVFFTVNDDVSIALWLLFNGEITLPVMIFSTMEVLEQSADLSTLPAPPSTPELVAVLEEDSPSPITGSLEEDTDSEADLYEFPEDEELFSPVGFIDELRAELHNRRTELHQLYQLLIERGEEIDSNDEVIRLGDVIGNLQRCLLVLESIQAEEEEMGAELSAFQLMVDETENVNRATTPPLDVYSIEADPADQIMGEDESGQCCVICMENRARIEFNNCRHRVLCGTCHKRQLITTANTSCPICRELV